MKLWCADRVYIKGRFEQDWGILINDQGLIEAIGPCQKLVARAKTVQHHNGRVMMPAFVNPHHHGFHRLFRGALDFYAPFAELRNNLIWPLSAAVDRDLAAAAFKVALAEQAMAGVGTVAEFHYLHNGAYHTPGEAQFSDVLIQTALDLGIRLVLVYSLFDQGDPENARAFIQPLDVAVETFERLATEYKNHPLIKVVPGIHGLSHTSPEAIMAAAELAEKYQCKLHIQLAERPAELESSETQYGTSPLRALEKMELLDKRLVLINGTLLDEEELAIAKRKGINMVVCPSASLARGDAFPNTLGILREKLPFAVASDSLAMCQDYAPTEEIKLLELTQRSVQKHMNILQSSTSVQSLWDFASQCGADTLDLETAQLMPGSPADFMLLKLHQPCSKNHYSDDGTFLTNQLVYNWSNQVEVTHLVVQGRAVMRNGRLPVDLGESYQRLEEWRAAFVRTMHGTEEKDGDPAAGDPATGDPAAGDPATGDPAAGGPASAN